MRKVKQIFIDLVLKLKDTLKNTSLRSIFHVLLPIPHWQGVSMVIIEGVAGVGKTTLQKMICQKMNNSYMLIQDFEHNICLEDFYQGESCLLQKQMIFLFSDYHVLSSSIIKNLNKIIISDFSLERSDIMAKRYLSKYEYENLFLPCYQYLMEKVQNQRKMLILLYASPEHILENIAKRNRSMERGIQLQYIHERQELLMEELPKYSFDKVVRINCDCENLYDDSLVVKLNREILCFEQKYQIV